MKQQWKPGTMIFPLPAVLVTCGTAEKSNMLTVAWTGTICTDPAMCYISVRPERASYPLICEQMEFTINLTTEDMARATDWAGVRSGRDYDKWAETGLTPEPGRMVGCPSIAEAPLSIECRVKEIVKLGSHDMFIAEVLCVLAREDLIDPETGAFRLGDARLLNYAHGNYYGQGPHIGRFGWTVKKKK
ncbi:MAG: flavin reductase family protein [Bacteroides sp.]|nr:flavin reductase family protein [Bacteroides sp.]MDE6051349.1 flavin reductase family protein [Paramuribaculum sp.]MBD5297660.1 flavin reductase family protein [Bacteroides sp.]MBD5320231.1 flavin reductase family protein [Bacteroides sp.]MBD5350908.1 flavin reductase family protein [Bacteroides sp.]